MKRRILAISLAAISFAVAGSSLTLSYFTDTSAVQNSFVVGSADIELFRWYDPIGNFYGKDQILGENGINARYDNWLGATSNMLVGGKQVAMYPYVSNVGNIDVYVRINMYIPNDIYDYVTFTWSDSIDSYGSGNENVDWLRITSTHETIGGVDYRRVSFYSQKPVAPNRKTASTPITAIGLSRQAIIDNPDLSGFVDSNGKLTVKMTADAVQAYGFNSVKSAFNFIDNN